MPTQPTPSAKISDAEPDPAPKPTSELQRATVTDLWVVTIVPAVFGGLIASAPLAGTSTEGGPWTTFLVVIVCVLFFTFAVLLLGVPRLEELRRRGAWVPPVTDRAPVLVVVALALLIMTVVGLFMHSAMWLLQHSGLAS